MQRRSRCLSRANQCSTVGFSWFQWHDVISFGNKQAMLKSVMKFGLTFMDLYAFVLSEPICSLYASRGIQFLQHISKQRVLRLPEDLMKKGKHFILPSFDKVVTPSFFELGLLELVLIYKEFSENGKPPLVIDAEELQKDPEATLRGLCDDLEIPFQPSMLSWEAGPKPIDGLWAPWWYNTIQKSTGFKEQKKYPKPFPFALYDLLEKSLPLYNMLRRHVKKKSSLLSSPLPPPKLPGPANEKLLVWVGDEIVTREYARVFILQSFKVSCK